MKKILLLDYDYTIYPSTLNTVKAVEARVNLYIRTFLGCTRDAAEAMRIQFWDQYGSTLRGLEEHFGVNRDHYCDFIYDIDDSDMPPSDPKLAAWFQQVSHPTYIFTNARKDWIIRGLNGMGLDFILPSSTGMVAESNCYGCSVSKLRGIFDIAFVNWLGKPHLDAYAKVDDYLRLNHGNDIVVFFADDRRGNLETARIMHWKTIWIVPHNAINVTTGTFDCVLPSLSGLNPHSLV